MMTRSRASLSSAVIFAGNNSIRKIPVHFGYSQNEGPKRNQKRGVCPTVDGHPTSILSSTLPPHTLIPIFSIQRLQ